MANVTETRVARLEASARAQWVVLRALVSSMVREKSDPAAALAALFDDANQILDFADDQTDLPQLRVETAAIRKRVESFFTMVRVTL
jgi:hypothetical protein